MAQNYDLFFSYRHKPLDTEITEGCFQFSESFRMPKTLLAKGHHGVRRAFRDKEELSVSRILTETIDDALRSADYLVIVCTTQTPESEWVDREIEIFTEEGKADHIFPLLVNGTPETSFVPSLKKIPDIEDRILDVRSGGDDPKVIMEKARHQLVRVIAAIADVGEETLRREVKLEQNKQLGLKAAIGVGFVAGLAIVVFLLSTLAMNYRTKAQQAKEASMTILSELTYGLPDALVSLPGTYSRTASILKDNTEQINEILLLSGDAPEIQSEAASNLERLADACTKLGLYQEAEDAQRTALDTFTSLNNSDSFRHLISGWQNLGNLLTLQARYEEADTCYETALKLLEDGSVEDINPLDRIVILGNRAINKIEQGYKEEGMAEMDSVITELENANLEPSSEASNLYYSYGRILLSIDTVQAELALTRSVEIRRAVLETESTPQNLSALIDEAALLGTAYLNGGKYDQATSLFEELLPDAASLSEDTENTQYLQKTAVFYNNYGLALSDVGDHQKAGEAYQKSATLYGQIHAILNTTNTAAAYAQALVNAADNEMMSGNVSSGQSLFEQGFALYDSIYDQLSDYYKGEYLGYRCYYKMVFGDPWEALDDASQAVTLTSGTVIRSYYAFSLMFCGEYEACDDEIQALMLTGSGTIHAMLNDLNALEGAGAYDAHMEEIRAMLQSE